MASDGGTAAARQRTTQTTVQGPVSGSGRTSESVGRCRWRNSATGHRQRHPSPGSGRAACSGGNFREAAQCARRPRHAVRQQRRTYCLQRGVRCVEERQVRRCVAAVFELLELYPNGVYTPNALYWLGESYYATRNFPLAEAQFRDLVGRYPTHDKASGGLLKLGLSQYGEGKNDEAQQTLQQVASQYPGSDAARVAQERLQSIRLGQQLR
ncbi:tol-pal system protein YbgF [Xanthomonas populi]